MVFIQRKLLKNIIKMDCLRKGSDIKGTNGISKLPENNKRELIFS